MTKQEKIALRLIWTQLLKECDQSDNAADEIKRLNKRRRKTANRMLEDLKDESNS